MFALAYAVATATSQELARERLALAGLDGMFPDIVGGDQVKHGKPDPDIYVIAAKTLGIPPEECVAVEDSPNGIAAGLDAGYRNEELLNVCKNYYNCH